MLLSILVFACWNPAPVRGGLDTAWVRYYAGPGSFFDLPWDVAIDDSGSVLVTGGRQLGPSGPEDYGTVKYDRDGNQTWSRAFKDADHLGGSAYSIAVDEIGNVLVTGESYGTSTGGDIGTVKYAPNGDTLWTRRYDGPAHNEDRPWDICVDSGGRVFIAASSAGSNPYNDFLVIGYSPSGNLTWEYRSATTGGANAVGADRNGNVYATGYDTGGALTIKLSPGGGVLWERNYNDPDLLGTGADALVVDRDGNVLVAGRGFLTQVDVNYITIKYSPAGDTLWVRMLDGPAHGDDAVRAIAVDSSGNCAVTGRARGIASGFDVLTGKYDASGNLMWARVFEDQAGGWDEGVAIKMTPDGDVFVLAVREASGFLPKFALLHYEPFGTVVDSALGIGYPMALALDADGNAYVTGFVTVNYSGRSTDEYFTAKYAQCSCPCMADPQCDGIRADILDVVGAINVAVRGESSLPSPSCRIADSDVNCSGQTDIVDVALLIDVAFRDADPQSVFCHWCGAQ